MTEIVQDANEDTATPGLSSIIAKRVKRQACEAMAEHELGATITHIAEYDNPNHPGTYRVQFEGQLSKEQIAKLEGDAARFPVVGLDWFVFKPDFSSVSGAGVETKGGVVSALSPAPAPDPLTVDARDPRDAKIADLERQIAELTARQLASQPAVAEAIREEIRTFPSEPGTRYFVGEITYEQNQRATAIEFDKFEAECTLVCEEFKGFDTGQRPKLWHVARGKRRSTPPTNGDAAKAFATAFIPEPATNTAVSDKIIQNSEPLMTLFVNSMTRNPLVEEVWRRGPDAVMEDMLAEGARRGVDFIFEHMPAARDTLALVGSDLND